MLNSYYGQYLYAPLHVTAGQRVRLWVLDVGPSGDSSFHVVGGSAGYIDASVPGR